MLSLRQSLAKIDRQPPIRIPSQLPLPGRSLRDTLSAWNAKDSRFQNPFRNFLYYYKAQTHVHGLEGCHGKPGCDADQGEHEVERAYRSKGYSFIFLTNHNMLTPDPQVGCDDAGRCILHVPAAECGWLCRHHLIVLNLKDESLLGTTAAEQIVIAAANSSTAEQIGAAIAVAIADLLDPFGLLVSGAVSGAVLYEQFEQDCDDFQGKIDRFRDAGAMVVLAHPRGTYKLGGPTYELSEALNTGGYIGMEIWSGGNDSVDYWDAVLSIRDPQVWGFCSDDCENLLNLNVFNRGWIVVNSNKGPVAAYMDGGPKSAEIREDIVQNIQAGNFYAVVRSHGERTSTDGSESIGPKLMIWTTGCTVHVRVDQESITKFKGWGGKCLRRVGNATSAAYTLDGTEDYVRVEVAQWRTDGDPKGEDFLAYSQPLAVIPLGGVQGHVRGECGPVLNASLTFTRDQNPRIFSTNTDLLGDYSIRLPRGTYTLTAYSDDEEYDKYTAAVSIKDKFINKPIAFYLKQGSTCKLK